MAWRSLFVGAASLVASCVVFENPVPKDYGCNDKATVADGEACSCNAQCKSAASGGYCFAEGELDLWEPRGVCSHECSLDTDCDEGAGCSGRYCYRRCDVSADCSRGRTCFRNHGEVSLCIPFCDEHSDCRSGNCNFYSGNCLPDGAEPEGRGLEAECTQNGECKSGYCGDGRCRTSCDRDQQRCPEEAFCNARGYCTLECSKSTGCPDAGSCRDDDAGVTCE